MHSEGHLRRGNRDCTAALTERRDSLFGAVSRQTGRHPGRHLQPAVFYARVAPNFQAARHCWHDIAGQGIGGPSLGDVTASKLEYADDVGLLDWTAAEASERVSALASESRTSASMEMSAPKSKGMHVYVSERLSVSTEAEVEALDLPHSCPECERTFPTTRGLAVHRARWCRPGQRSASRRSQLADKAVKLAKRKASAALLPPVVMEGEPPETVYQFDYLGCRFTSDADDAADMRHRMAIAGERSRSLGYLWRDNRLPRSQKLPRSLSVCSTLTHGSEAWTLTPKALATLNGFNSRQLHRITERSYREEATSVGYHGI